MNNEWLTQNGITEGKVLNQYSTIARLKPPNIRLGHPSEIAIPSLYLCNYTYLVIKIKENLIILYISVSK